MDDVRPFSQRYGEVQMFMDDRCAENLKERFDYIFATENSYAGAPKVCINIFENQSLSCQEKRCSPIEVMHGNLKIFGFRIDKMAYITDAKTVTEKEKNK